MSSFLTEAERHEVEGWIAANGGKLPLIKDLSEEQRTLFVMYRYDVDKVEAGFILGVMAGNVNGDRIEPAADATGG